MKSIFAKTFFSSMFLTLAVLLLSFLLICLLMPPLYLRYKTGLLAQDLDHIVSTENGKTLEVIEDSGARKADEKGYLMYLLDEKGEVVYTHGLQTISSYVIQKSEAGENVRNAKELQNSREVNEVQEVQEVNEVQEVQEVQDIREVNIRVISKEGRITDDQGKVYSIIFLASPEPVDEAKGVILRLLPIVALLSLLMTAAFSYLHARRITKPVGRIVSSVRQMKELERDAKCDDRSGDEIGDLADNINELYERLMRTIDDLQAEYDRQTALDQERIDLMLTLSHELKTPLTSMKGMLECMQYNIGVYSDHETYLKECTEKVDEMSSLIGDTLAASRLGLTRADEKEEVLPEALVRELIREYELIAMKRGISLKARDLAGLRILTSEKLFRKALSNILSNAVKYSTPHTSVRIFGREGNLVIENDCEPLSAEQAEEVFRPFVRGKREMESGHGLGLYLTDRILKVCGIDYSFEPLDDGMRFTLFLKNA